MPGSAFDSSQHDAFDEIPLHEGIHQQDRDDADHGDGILDHPLIQHVLSGLLADGAALAHHGSQIAGGQSPIPNPLSPIPNPQSPILKLI